MRLVTRIAMTTKTPTIPRDNAAKLAIFRRCFSGLPELRVRGPGYQSVLRSGMPRKHEKALTMTARHRAESPGQSATLKHTAGFVSVKTLAESWDCSRTTVSRILDGAGVRAFYFGSGPNGAKRYRRGDVDRFLQSLPQSEPVARRDRKPRITARVRKGVRGEQTESSSLTLREEVPQAFVVDTPNP